VDEVGHHAKGPARHSAATFITNICNTEHLHCSLGYRSPLEFETAFEKIKKH
jgi:hypothetical protein